MLSILIVFGVRVRIYINSLEHIRRVDVKRERERESENDVQRMCMASKRSLGH